MMSYVLSLLLTDQRADSLLYNMVTGMSILEKKNSSRTVTSQPYGA